MNKKGLVFVLLFLLALPLVLGSPPVLQSTNNNYGNGNSGGLFQGMKFNVTTSSTGSKDAGPSGYYILNATITGTTYSRCRLYLINSTNHIVGGQNGYLTDGVLSGTKCIFNTSVELEVGSFYGIDGDGTGSATQDYDSSPTAYPNIASVVTWTQSCGGNIDWNTPIICGTTDSRGGLVNFYLQDIAPPPPPFINVTYVSPSNNTQWNTLSLDFNVSVVSQNFTTATCSFYRNESLVETKNTAIPGFPVFNDTYNVTTESLFIYRTECNSTLAGSPYGFNSSVLTLYVDNVFPTITTDAFDTALIGSRMFNVTFHDVNLFSYSIVFNNTLIENQSNLAVQTINTNVTINTHSYSPGRYHLNFTASDGHTAEQIPVWSTGYNILTKSLTYKDTPNDEGFVKIVPVNAFDFASSFNTEKKKDRYSFTYHRAFAEKIVNGNDLKFRVISSSEIVIPVKTGFRGWLIVPGLNKWVDFETTGNVGKYEVKRIDAYTVEVIIHDVQDDTITFNSIGSLNVISTVFQINIANVTTSYTNPVQGGATQTMNLTLDFFNSSIVNNSYALLNYNGSIKNPTRTISGTKHLYTSSFVTPTYPDTIANVTFHWNYNITLSDLSFQYNQTAVQVQNVYDFGFINCTNESIEVLQFTGRDENTEDKILYTMQIDIDISFGGNASTLSQGFDFSGANNYTICLPINVTDPAGYTVDALISYESENLTGVPYADRKYYLVDMPLGQNFTLNLTNIDLYLLPSSDASEIVHTTVDKITGGKVPGAYIKLLKRYVGQQTSKVVEVAQTDQNGETLMKVLLADTLYSYIVEYNGQVVATTDVQKIFSGTKRLELDLGSDILESQRQIGGLYTNVSCTNSTLTCSMVWSDSTGLVSTADFYVYRQNGFGRTQIYYAQGTGSAGVLSYTINESTAGNEYIAQGFIDTNTRYSVYNVGQDALVFVQNLRGLFGIEVLMPYLWMLIAFVGLFLETGSATLVIGALGIMVLVGVIIGTIPISTPALVSMLVIFGMYIAKAVT